MRASRLLSILILLQLRVRVTADALAEEFEVSARTIYRDIDALSAAGVPVYAERGPGGGFQLVDGYRTELTGLTLDEAKAMCLIGLPGPAAAFGIDDAAERARAKLLAALPRGASDEALRVEQRFHLDAVDWYRAAEPVPWLPLVSRAVLDCRVMVMTYESWRGVREHRVEPLGLVLKAGAWYFVAQPAEGDALRIYKVAGMRAATLTDERFARPRGFDLPSAWATALARFEAGLRRGRASVRASAEGCRRLAELGAWAAEAVRAAGPLAADGWRDIDLPIESLEHSARVLLGIGAQIEVTAPAALRACIHALATEVAGRHAPAPGAVSPPL